MTDETLPGHDTKRTLEESAARVSRGPEEICKAVYATFALYEHDLERGYSIRANELKTLCDAARDKAADLTKLTIVRIMTKTVGPLQGVDSNGKEYISDDFRVMITGYELNPIIEAVMSSGGGQIVVPEVPKQLEIDETDDGESE